MIVCPSRAMTGSNHTEDRLVVEAVLSANRVIIVSSVVFWVVGQHGQFLAHLILLLRSLRFILDQRGVVPGGEDVSWCILDQRGVVHRGEVVSFPSTW